jgi:hypothetical protein
MHRHVDRSFQRGAVASLMLWSVHSGISRLFVYRTSTNNILAGIGSACCPGASPTAGPGPPGGGRLAVHRVCANTAGLHAPAATWGSVVDTKFDSSNHTTRAAAGIGSTCGLDESPTPDLREPARAAPRARKYLVKEARSSLLIAVIPPAITAGE